MKLAIIKYNAGNIQSVLYALERIGVSAEVTDEPAAIRAAEKVIFPGVGEASTAMEYLRERGLDAVIRELRQPVLGICLGMQLMCSHSEENDTACMGIFGETVRRFGPDVDGHGFDGGGGGRGQDTGGGGVLKVPQIGWNNIYDLGTALFEGVAESSYCYFVHGYYAALGEHTIAKTAYGREYSSALCRGNYYGVQFHPEKSAQAGERILRNFVETIR
jgi:imidazole glycerol-phosphate synthase subunit HisH